MYHISRHFLGEKAKFIPRIPVSQNECELNLPPRVCASKTIEQCWAAIRGCRDLLSMMKRNHTNGYYFFVYTFNSESFEQNTTVLDFNETGEMISKIPVEGELVEVFYINRWKLDGKFNLNDIKENSEIDEAIIAYENWQSKDLLEIERILESKN